MAQFQKFGMKTKPAAHDELIEHPEDLMAKMNLKMSEKTKDDSISPRVAAIKDDVLFIKNPNPLWKFNDVLTLNSKSGLTHSALLISL